MAFRAGILTISDRASRGERIDTAGPAVASLIAAAEGNVAETATISDDREAIASLLRLWADQAHLDLILTTGGTGLSPRDVTPEATLDIADRQAPGIAEVMRLKGRESTHLSALSRAVVGTRGRTLIINLPGSERGARESLEAVLDLLPHAIDMLQSEPVEQHPVDEV
jgi:molybdopterin adenylyltransferase